MHVIIIVILLIINHIARSFKNAEIGSSNFQLGFVRCGNVKPDITSEFIIIIIIEFILAYLNNKILFFLLTGRK